MVRRLLTDAKMQNVWPVLQRTSAQPYALVEWQRLRRTKTLDANARTQDKACAVFFYCAMLAFGGMSLHPPMWTRKELDESASRWRSAAQMCRDEKRRLFEWWQVEAAEVEVFPEDAKPAAELDVDLAMALAIVDEHFERRAQQYESPVWSACIIDRSSKNRGDDRARVGVRVLGAETHKLFGQYLYGTLATVATAALQTAITEKSVKNWCGGL
jgi:hypothetical protein